MVEPKLLPALSRRCAGPSSCRVASWTTRPQYDHSATHASIATSARIWAVRRPVVSAYIFMTGPLHQASPGASPARIE